MSNGTRIYLSLYVGFVVYCVGVLFWGQTGIFPSGSLERFKGRLEVNLAHLESINMRLAQQFDNLRSDPVSIGLESRQLGYLPSGEHPIDIDGYNAPESSFAVGTVLSAPSIRGATDGTFRIIGLGAALLFFAGSIAFARSKNGIFSSRSSGEVPSH